MARPLNDSPYLYGLHDPGGEQIMAERGTYGWILFTEALGSDPNDQSGGNYSQWADQGYGILVRLNNGYEPHGTIPYSNRYAEFAARCANFVGSSAGCHIWIIGNEMNIPVERPGVHIDRGQDPPRLVQPGEIILPGLYANCFRRCREAIRAVPGHESDQVIVGGVAPWNAQTTYNGNDTGDWIQYFQEVLSLLSPDKCDGIAIHTYTHGSDPKLIYTDGFMDPPFRNRQYNFRTYRDFMNAIPRSMRSLPVYLTETDQNDPWANTNNGWVQRAYGEIDWWNQQPGNQVIRAMILYRWSKADQWVLEGRAGVLEDFKQAMQYRYNWETALQRKGGTVAQPEKPTPDVTTPVTDTPKPKVETSPAVIDTAPIKFDLTGKTANGLFAAFHRKYGLELTGYPITDEYIATDSGLKTQDWQRLSMEEYQGAIRLRLAAQEAVTLRQQITDLTGKITRLEKQIGRITSGIGGAAEPAITDITARLPRDAAGFVKRVAGDIQFLVINHTGVRPEVDAVRVAQAQRAKWPGIVSQYFITVDGSIQQTNPIDEVVTRDQSWIFNGVNIYVAGNFDETTPGEPQLAALAQLCAWLLNRYSLAIGAIRGVSEFIVTRSPGVQWLQGQRWKDRLLERVAAIPAGPATPTPQAGSDAQVAALRDQVSRLQTQAADLQAQLIAAEATNGQLQAQVQDLLRRASAATRLAQPALTDISLQLSRTTGSLKPRPVEQIKYVVINHTAVDPSVAVERIAAAHQKRWGGILYQYLITAEGAILQTNSLTEVVDLGQPWIAQGVNVAVAGNFSGDVPSDAQIKAAAQLTAWLMQEHAIPPENVKGVSEFVVTQSPGTQWLSGKKWRDLLLAAIAEVQKTVPVGPATPVTPTPGDAAALAVLRAQVVTLQANLNQASAKISALQQERDRLLAQLREPAPGDATLTQQVQALAQQVQALATEKTTLTQQTQTLAADKTALTKQVQSLTADKNSLSQQNQALTNDKVALGQQLQAYAREKAALTQQVQTLTATNTTLGQQVTAAATERQTLTRKVSDLEARIIQLQSGIGTGGTGAPAQPAGPAAVQAPPITDLVDTLPQHATLKHDTRPLSQITHIAIHHSAAPANVTPQRIAAYHVSKDWPAMGYHFYVGPDGVIYQTERLETISNHVYKQNHYSMGICIAGSFINGVIPTPKQIESVGNLVAWLTQKLNVPMKNVWGHKEFPGNQTACPGSDWMTGKNWKQMVIDRANAVLNGQTGTAAKTIGHYMLFWQRADAWAQQDWDAAEGYFARFRPTAGFSADDARNAEYITIVGGVAGVPFETEQSLIAAGCKVERLAGVDFNDTKKMLDDLVSAGKRFKTFSV